MVDGEGKNTTVTEQSNEARQWHFWFAVSFSLFLVVMFVYYLPLRFQFNALHGEDEHMMEDGAMMMNDDEHGGHGAIAHEEESVTSGLAVHFSLLSAPVMVGTSTTLKFFVNEKPSGIGVSVSDLEIEHEKLMHVIGVRDDMNEFFHIHPAAAQEAGILESSYAFSKPGHYKIWSEIKKDGVIHSFGHAPFEVSGEGAPSDKQVSFGRSVVVGGYQILLEAGEPIAKGMETDLSFDVHDSFGNEIDVEPYLGADMHLSIIKDDWSEFIHTHPEGHNDMMHDDDDHALLRVLPEAWAHGGAEESPVMSADEHINFHVTFPAAGLYRAYAQFRPVGSDINQDEALTAMFWVQIEEKAPLAFSPWWVLLIVSLLLIVVLSKFVKKYIGEDM